MSRLHLLRHAKSCWDDPALADHDRPLAPRGRRAATQLATWLETSDVRPAIVLCSTAVRTRQTLELVLGGLGDPLVVHEEGLYHTPAAELLARLRELPAGAPEVLVVGHNPGLQELVLALVPPGREPRGERDRVAVKLPTCALVTLDVPGGWSALEQGAARISRYLTPHDLGSS
jgi:phosphohistidine phosphatase